MSQLTTRLISVAALLALGGCASSGAGMATASPPTVLDAWSGRVQVTAQPDEIRLAAHPTGLSGNQARALAEFHMRWMQAEGGLITVAAPNAGGYRIGTETRAYLLSLGLRTDQVQLVGYDGDGEAPVVVGYQRYSVATPRCGDWGPVNRSFSNEPMAGFGCAVTANMAAQVANPGDLVAPRTMDPADPGRRATVIGKYRSGEITSSAKDSQASGAVSQAIQ